MILTRMIDINKMLKLTQGRGQGHKVKGQGQLSKYVKKLALNIYNELMF